jgi:hypothetical protein
LPEFGCCAEDVVISPQFLIWAAREVLKSVVFNGAMTAWAEVISVDSTRECRSLWLNEAAVLSWSVLGVRRWWMAEPGAGLAGRLGAGGPEVARHSANSAKTP